MEWRKIFITALIMGLFMCLYMEILFWYLPKGVTSLEELGKIALMAVDFIFFRNVVMIGIFLYGLAQYGDELMSETN